MNCKNRVFQSGIGENKPQYPQQTEDFFNVELTESTLLMNRVDGDFIKIHNRLHDRSGDRQAQKIWRISQLNNRGVYKQRTQDSVIVTSERTIRTVIFPGKADSVTEWISGKKLSILKED